MLWEKIINELCKKEVHIAFFVNDVLNNNIQCSFLKKETTRKFLVNNQNGMIIRMSEKNGKRGNNCKIVLLWYSIFFSRMLRF